MKIHYEKREDRVRGGLPRRCNDAVPLDLFGNSDTGAVSISYPFVSWIVGSLRWSTKERKIERGRGGKKDVGRS